MCKKVMKIIVVIKTMHIIKVVQVIKTAYAMKVINNNIDHESHIHYRDRIGHDSYENHK